MASESGRKGRRRAKPRKPLAVVWTERALSDLEAIGDFIAVDNPVAAERWVGVLMAAAQRAAVAPRAGRRVPELGRDDVREVLKRTYRIVYRVKRGSVQVLPVFEGHRLFPKNVGREDDVIAACSSSNKF